MEVVAQFALYASRTNLCLLQRFGYRVHGPFVLFFFLFTDTATPEIYTLSLHDALPISRRTLISSGQVFGRTRPRLRAATRPSRELLATGVPADVMPPHDLQKAGMIREAECLRRPGDVPVVMLQRRDDDLPFGLGLEIMKRARDRVRLCSP